MRAGSQTKTTTDGERSLPAAVAALLRRRSVAGLLAVVLLPVLAGSGCGFIGDSESFGSPRRVEKKATSPPPGLPASFTTGQRLRSTKCPSGDRDGAKPRGDGWECATMTAPLDYRRPGRATIDVALIRKRATGRRGSGSGRFC